MSDKTDAKLDQIIQEMGELRGDVQGLKTDVRELKTDVKTIKHVQGEQGMRLRTVQIDVRSLKGSYRTQAEEVKRLGGLFEDFEHRFQTAGEADP